MNGDAPPFEPEPIPEQEAPDTPWYAPKDLYLDLNIPGTFIVSGPLGENQAKGRHFANNNTATKWVISRYGTWTAANSLVPGVLWRLEDPCRDDKYRRWAFRVRTVSSIKGVI